MHVGGALKSADIPAVVEWTRMIIDLWEARFYR